MACCSLLDRLDSLEVPDEILGEGLGPAGDHGLEWLAA
jgi:hypothetical protein